MLERSQNLLRNPATLISALRGCFFHAKCTRVQNRESLCNLRESEALQARYRLACELAKAGAELAFEYYQQREALTVDHKGDDLQDVVSVADKRVESLCQTAHSERVSGGWFSRRRERRPPARRAECCGWSTPSMAPAVSSTACTPWCLSLAIVADGEPVIGVVYDPNHRELFHALRGHGAWPQRRSDPVRTPRRRSKRA